MKQSFIFSRKDCQVQKVHLFEEHQRQWEVEGENFAEVFKKFQYWWIPGAKEVKYYHKCPAISSSRLTFLMGFSLCFKPFWERSFLSRKLKHNWFKNFNWPPQVSDNTALCLKITEKVSFDIASEASYVYIFSGQKFVKNAKNGRFGEFLKNWSLRSNSVTRQVTFKGTKIGWKCKSWKPSKNYYFGHF